MAAKRMNAIISTSIKFQSAEDVAAYKALGYEDIPSDDMEYNRVSRYVVGFRHIVLFDEIGRLLATFNRRNVRGFAIDGEPVVIHGQNFQRIGIAAEA